MKPEWAEEIFAIHERAVGHKKLIEPWSIEDVRFLALALAGEVGELANRIKKQWRGDDDQGDPRSNTASHEELVDIRVYVELLSKAFNNLDLDNGVRAKLPIIRAKFEQIGEKPADWDEKHRDGNEFSDVKITWPQHR